jgi:hypothetical protein
VWAKRVERWSASGLTAKQFAAEIGVSPQSLTFWKWKLRRDESTPARSVHSRRDRPQPSTPPTAAFLQLVTASTSEVAQSLGMLELVLFNGLTVRVPVGFDETTLTRLVATFGGG